VTHNRSELLKRALLSILSCTSDNYEIILCADDTSQKTFEVAKDYLRAHDTFLRMPSIKGPAESRNIGAKFARGKWITFLDDDDTFNDGHISKILNLVPNKNNKVLYCNYKRVIENRETSEVTTKESVLIDISNHKPIDLLTSNFIPIHAMVISSEIFTKHSFDPYLQSYEDWDFLISLFTSGVEFEWIDCGNESVLVHIDASESSRNNSSNARLDSLSIFRKWPAPNDEVKLARLKKITKTKFPNNLIGLKIDFKHL